MGIAIRAESLTKQFGPVRAVNNLSLTVGRGEIYGFLGLNGAGKSTTIRMLLGMVRPDEGQVWIFGHKVTAGDRQLWSRIGYMAEGARPYPGLTVAENLHIMARLRGIRSERASRAVDEVLDLVLLTPYRNRRAGALSMGNAQRLGLGKALVHDPRVLILDEPANGLDPAGLAMLRDLLSTLSRHKGVTVFLSSHLLAEVDRLAHRIGIIHRGALIKGADSSHIAGDLRRWLLLKTRDRRRALAVLRSSGYPDAAPAANDRDAIEVYHHRAADRPEIVAKALADAGVPPTFLAVQQEDLEGYFFRLLRREGESP